jgi:hypothetical protein
MDTNTLTILAVLICGMNIGSVISYFVITRKFKLLKRNA